MSKRQLPWKLFAIWTAAAVLLVFAIAIDEGESGTLFSLGNIAIVLGLAPLIGALFTLGAPRALTPITSWVRTGKNALLYLSGITIILFVGMGLMVGRFNPYTAVIFGIGVFATLGTLLQMPHGQAGFTWTDAMVWLWLWIPFDLRWYNDLWPGPDGFSYNWWAIMLCVVAVIGWRVLRGLDFGYRLAPRLRDFGVAFVLFAIFAAIIIPLGLAIDFISFPPTTPFTLTALAANFVGIFLTVALPEELFFRGILLHGLTQTSKNKWMPMLISSVAFGLMHWNNAGDLSTQIAYVALATVAGWFYGMAYRRSGNNILAAVLLHTFVDVMWRFLFQ